MYDNDKTFDKLYPVLLECLQYLSEQLGDNEWQKGNDTKSAFVKNNVISGIIRVINSLVNYLSNNQKINPLADNYKKIVNEMKSYLKIIAEFWKNISEEEKIELSTSYGAGGPIKSCRTFEREINSHFHSFNPEGLEKYWKDRNRKNTDESIILLNTVLDVIKTSVKEMLDNKFGEGHLDLWAPKNIATRLQTKVAEHNYGKERSQYKDIWDFIDFIDLREIIIFGSNWTEVFNKKFTYPSICKGDKKEKTKWLENIFEIRKKSTHNRRERPVCGHRGRSRGPFYYRITTFGKGPWDARDPHKTTFMALKHVIRLSIWQRQKETPGVEKAPGVSSPQRKESGRSGRDDGELRFGYDPAIHARRLRVYHRPRRLRMASRISIFFAARRFEPLNSMG